MSLKLRLPSARNTAMPKGSEIIRLRWEKHPNTMVQPAPLEVALLDPSCLIKRSFQMHSANLSVSQVAKGTQKKSSPHYIL